MITRPSHLQPLALAVACLSLVMLTNAMALEVHADQRIGSSLEGPAKCYDENLEHLIPCPKRINKDAIILIGVFIILSLIPTMGIFVYRQIRAEERTTARFFEILKLLARGEALHGNPDFADVTQESELDSATVYKLGKMLERDWGLFKDFDLAKGAQSSPVTLEKKERDISTPRELTTLDGKPYTVIRSQEADDADDAFMRAATQFLAESDDYRL